MKTFIGALIFLITQSTLAATINLTSGESIKIKSNKQSTVTCNGSDPSCKGKTEVLEKRLSLCMKSNQAAWCLDQFWEPFKQANPSCTEEASILCLDNCVSSLLTNLCLERCR